MTTWTWTTKKSEGYGYEFTVYKDKKPIKTQSGYGTEGFASMGAKDWIDLQIEGKRITAIQTK